MADQMIACPRCGTRLRLRRSSNAAIQFACSHCGQTLKLAAKIAPADSAASSPPVPAQPAPQATATPAAGQPIIEAEPVPAAEPAIPVAQPAIPVAQPAIPVAQPAVPVAQAAIPVAQAAPVQAAPGLDGIDGYGPRGPNGNRAAPSAPANWPPRPQRPRTKRNFKPILAAVGILVGVGMLGGIGYLVYLNLPVGTIANLNPMADSPESILSGLKSTLGAAATELDSINDANSRDAAMTKINALAEDARALQRRAVMLNPIPEERRLQIEKRFASELDPVRERMKSAMAQVRNRDLANRALAESTILFSFALADAATAVSVGWKEFPEPKNDWEQLEYEKSLIKREMWRKVLCTVTEADYQTLPGELSEIPPLYEALQDLQTKVAQADPSQSSAFSPYRDFNFDFGFQTAQRLEKLQQQFGENTALVGALAKIRSAESELTGIKMQIEMEADPVAFGAVPPHGFGQQPGRPGYQRTQPPGYPRTSPPGYRPRSLEPVPGSGGQPGRRVGIIREAPPEFDLAAPPDSPSANERRLQNFTRAQGRDSVVVIRFTGLAEDVRLGAQAAKLNTTLGKAPTIIAREGSRALMAYRYESAPGEVAELIDVGKVTQTDVERRIIFVDASRRP